MKNGKKRSRKKEATVLNGMNLFLRAQKKLASFPRHWGTGQQVVFNAMKMAR